MIKKTCGDSGGLNAHGEPCGQTKDLAPENGLCSYHDPNRSEAARERSRRAADEWHEAVLDAKGAREAPPPPRSFADVTRSYAWLSWAVQNKVIPPAAANSSRASLREFERTLRIEERLRELEAALRKAGVKL